MVLEVVRWVIAAALVGAAGIAVGSWAVTTRRINPFSTLGQFIRRVSDPVLVPVEQRLLARGSNPQNAPWWLLGGVIVGGIVVLSLAGFLIDTAFSVERAVRGGPRALLEMTVWAVGNVLMLGLMVRVVGSWLGAGRYNKLTGWSWRLTDWIVLPIQRWLPPFGMFDFSPLVAFFAVWLAYNILMTLI